MDQSLDQLLVRRSRGNFANCGTWRQHIACGVKKPSPGLMRLFNEEADAVPAISLVLLSSKVFASVVLVIEAGRNPNAAVTMWINRVNERLREASSEELEMLLRDPDGRADVVSVVGNSDSFAWKGDTGD